MSDLLLNLNLFFEFKRQELTVHSILAVPHCVLMNFKLPILFFSFSGYEKSHDGVYISEIKPGGGAHDMKYDLLELKVGLQIKRINGKCLSGKSYLEIVEIIRDTRNSDTLRLLVTNIWKEPEISIWDQLCCTSM